MLDMIQSGEMNRETRALFEPKGFYNWSFAIENQLMFSKA